MLKPSTFVEQCQKAGFTPSGAMMLYDELRRFAFHSVEGIGVEEPSQALFKQFQDFALKELSNVSTPQDFKAYLKSWSNFDSGPLLKASPGARKVLDRYLNHDDVISRASGSIELRLPEQWQDWRDMGLDWEDVQAAISHDIPALSASAPAGVTAQQAQDKLALVMEKTQLAGFSWPFALENTPQNVWALAEDLQRCAQELGQATGWGDTALGLGQRVSVGFGMERSGVSGVCHMGKEGRSHIETSAATHWGSLAHEWLHALDNAINKAPVPSIPEALQADMTKAWKAMHQGLDRAAWEQSHQEQVRACLAITLVKQWETFPLTKATILQHFAAPELDEQAFLKQFQEAYGTENPAYEKSLLPIKALTALVDIKMSRDNLEEPSSLWTSFARRFKEEAGVHLNAKDAKDWEGYFLHPMERAAHSFEATFDKQTLVSDVEPNQSMRYPITPELSQHQLVWKRFFRTAGPWKQEIDAGIKTPLVSAQAAPEELSMAARRNLRLGDSRPVVQSPPTFSL